MDKKILLAYSLWMITESAHALDLVESYQRAFAYDASWQANQTRYQVEQRNLGIAKGAALPTVSVNAGVTRQYQDVGQQQNFAMAGQQINFLNDETTTRQASITVRQPLFRMDVWQKYKQVEISTQIADLTLQLQKQNLLLEVAQRYFDVLRQQSLLKLNQQEEAVLLKQYEMMQAKFEQGFVARMDVSEAYAQYQSARAKKVSSDVQAQLAREKLEQRIGPIEGTLADLHPKFEFQTPLPDDINAWLALAERNNLELNQQRLTHRSAQQQIKIDLAEYYPHIEAVGSSTWMKQSPQNIVSSDGRNDQIGLELNWTPYTGTRSKITEKSRQAAQAEAEEISVIERRIRTDVKGAYLQVSTAQSQLMAYKVAMESAQLVAQASQASYQEGLKTMVDVLLAQRNAFSAQQDYLKAQYDYLYHVLTLKASSGQLSETDLKELNQWLQ